MKNLALQILVLFLVVVFILVRKRKLLMRVLAPLYQLILRLIGVTDFSATPKQLT